MEYNKLKNETDFDYIIRLVEGKSDGTYDIDYTELFKLAFGVDFNTDECRKRYYGLKMLLPYLDKDKYKNVKSNDLIEELEQKRIELQKERRKFLDYRNAYNKGINKDARLEDLYDTIERTISSGNLPKLEYVDHKIEHTDNDLMVSLNDLHFGANINNAWNIYNSDICRERLNVYLDEIFEIQSLHNSENCYVNANGDLISGSIHLPIQVTNKEDLIEQIMGVSECIAQFLQELSKRFNKVIFTVVAGNHSRIGFNKDDSLKSERLDDLIPWYINARLQNVDNISITKNLDNTMSVVNIRGKKYLNVHGDYDGGKSAIQSASLMSGQDIYALCCGHLHHNMMDYANNIKVIMAGSLLGMDDYCVTKRIVGIPQQMVCVCNENGVKCSYDINFQ